MLNFKTYLKTSTIPNAGIGCFAAEFIPKGAIIWELNTLFDRVYSDLDFPKMSKLELDFINTYCYKWNNLYFLCVDNARFFNHSTEPNTIDYPHKQITIAARDINPHEEILSNYQNFGATPLDNKFNLTL